jgi:hypothetical protein
MTHFGREAEATAHRRCSPRGEGQGAWSREQGARSDSQTHLEPVNAFDVLLQDLVDEFVLLDGRQSLERRGRNQDGVERPASSYGSALISGSSHTQSCPGTKACTSMQRETATTHLRRPAPLVVCLGNELRAWNGCYARLRLSPLGLRRRRIGRIWEWRKGGEGIHPRLGMVGERERYGATCCVLVYDGDDSR